MRAVQTDRHESGFSLLELLLVIVVMALLTTGAIQIFNDWIQKSTNRTAVRQVLLLQNAAEEYVAANFATLIEAMPNNGDQQLVALQTLKDDGYLPTSFRNKTILQQNLQVIVINAGQGIRNEIIQVLTLTGDDAQDRRVPETRLLDAAMSGGPKMGTYTARTGGEIRSAYGEGAIEIADIGVLYTPTLPDIVEGGYMAAFGQISVEALIQSDYLYRVPMYDATGNQIYELNQMQTDLDMGGFSMLDAAALTVDQMQVSGNMSILGDNVTTAGFNPYALSVDEVLQVSGNDSRIGHSFSEDSSDLCRFVTIGGQVVVDSTLVGPGETCSIVGGELTVHGDTDDVTNDYEALSMRVDGSSVAGISNIQNTPFFGEAQFDQVNANEANSGRVVAETVTMQGTTLDTYEMRTGASAIFNSARINTGGLIGGNMNMQSGTVTAGQDMVIEQTYETYGSLSTNTFSAIRLLDMDQCNGHAKCEDANLTR